MHTEHSKFDDPNDSLRQVVYTSSTWVRVRSLAEPEPVVYTSSSPDPLISSSASASSSLDEAGFLPSLGRLPTTPDSSW